MVVKVSSGDLFNICVFIKISDKYFVKI